MSDEEKKAIKEIRSFNQYNWELNNLKTKKFAKPYFGSLDTILNLIEKQSKEIEELKREKAIYYYEWRHLEANIINKIEYYEKIDNPVGERVLQSLLEKE